MPSRSSIAMTDSTCHIAVVTESKHLSRRRDPNQLAKMIVDVASSEIDDRVLMDDGRDAVAVLMGRRGGLKGGPARAASMSSERRSEIARLAAEKRWSKPENENG